MRNVKLQRIPEDGPEARIPTTARRTFYNAKSTTKSRRNSVLRKQRHTNGTKQSGEDSSAVGESSSYRRFPAIYLDNSPHHLHGPNGLLRESGSRGSGRLGNNVRSLSRQRRPGAELQVSGEGRALP